MNKSIKPDVFTFTNYRSFLRACFQFKKHEARSFTYRSYSQQAGLGSPSALKEVIDGKKGLARKSIPKFISPFGLTKKESLYFESLVLFNQAKREADKNKYFAEMIKLHKLPRSKMITASQYAYYRNWFNSAIREIITLKDFKNDPQWIARAILPRITSAQAKKALNLLTQLKLIKKGKDGRLVQDAPQLEIDPDVSTLSIRNFNRNMIELGRESIERFEQKDREVSGLTLGVSEATYYEIKEKIRKFKKELLGFVGTDTRASNMVCQLNFQLFPLSERNGDTAT